MAETRHDWIASEEALIGQLQADADEILDVAIEAEDRGDQENAGRMYWLVHTTLGEASHHIRKLADDYLAQEKSKL